MEIEVDDQTTWWCLKAGRGGVLEDDWFNRGIVTIGWGDAGCDFRDIDPDEFLRNDPSHNDQLSKFIGYHENAMEEGDVVIAYAPGKGNVVGVGEVEEIRYNEDKRFQYLTEEQAKEAKVNDHYYWRSISWFDWETPVLVSDLSKRYQVNGADQIPTPMTLNQYGTLASARDRIETFAQEVSETETVETTGDGFSPEQESQIQDWVVNNIQELGSHTLPRKPKMTTPWEIWIFHHYI